jgi:hypothetical protein
VGQKISTMPDEDGGDQPSFVQTSRLEITQSQIEGLYFPNSLRSSSKSSSLLDSPKHAFSLVPSYHFGLCRIYVVWLKAGPALPNNI